MRFFYAKEMTPDRINSPWNESFQLFYTFKSEVQVASPGSVVEIDKHTVTYKIKGKSFQKECFMKEICPRGNNKVVIYISLYHDKCLLFMLELY